MQVFKAHENDPSGLGIVARHAAKLHSDGSDKLLIPGRPDHYQVPDGVDAYYWSTFESDYIPQEWVDNLNKATEVFVPHKSIRAAFIRSGVHKPVNVVPQGYTRYKRTQPLHRQANEPLRIGILGVPTQRKNVDKLVQAVTRLNGAVHLDIQAPWLVTPEQAMWSSPYVTLSVGRKTDDEIAEWYSRLDGYIYPSSGEGWSFTPREALAMGIPTILSDIPVHDELMPYVCSIESEIYEDAYYEFLKGTCGMWKAYTVDMITNALIDFANNYTHYRIKALEAANWIADKWQWDDILAQLKTEIEPKHLMLCPTRYGHCGINTYTEELLPYLPETKYVNSYSQIDSVLSHGNVESIHVQHEWGIFRTGSLLTEAGKWDCRKKITMHTVMQDGSVNQSFIANTFDDVYALTKRGAQKIERTHVPHGTSAPLARVSTGKKGTIGTFGFIHPQKGYQYIIPAAERAGFQVRIVGELNKQNGQSVQLHEQYILGNKRVQHIDKFVPYEEAYEWLKGCEILVYYYQKGRALYTSGSILHAARLGIPIICAQIPVFEDLATGTHQVPPGDENALYEAILRVSQDEEYKKQLVDGMDKILNEHLWEKIAKRFQ